MKGKGGSIVNISSISALRPRGLTTYTVSKAAVIGLTQAMAVDHGPDNKCWTLSILAEGYKADEIAKFITDANKFVNFFKAFKKN